MESLKNKKIAVIDFGGQYAHLIASRIRRLEAYSEIVSTDVAPDELKNNYNGIIYSGGPSSVYDADAPRTDPAILILGIPVLGICYGHQLIMHQLGGKVTSSSSREYGPAEILITEAAGMFEGEKSGVESRVWMSHGDEVIHLPEGFQVLGSTSDCLNAAVGDIKKNIYGLQYHPEVNDTERGDVYLKNFIRLCGLENSYSLDNFMEEEIKKIQDSVKDKKVFLLVSGGVDSTVAFAMLAKALPEDHLLGLFVDTGFMRKGEIEEVSEALKKLKVRLEVEDASDLYFNRLKEVYEPEKKRAIIGELFLDVQESVTERLGLNPDEWFLGQGTIYPDTIESGATKNSHLIKTHHNRVERIQKLLKEGKIIEPLRDLYKDEVRRLGMMLGLPEHLVMRHPFPGPGLAVRCLCNENEGEKIPDFNAEIKKLSDAESLLNKHHLRGVILPVKSVGVQGDKRSYAHPLALYTENEMPDYDALFKIAALLPNRISSINRVLYAVSCKSELENAVLLKKKYLTEERIKILRETDKIVHDFQLKHNLYGSIWQFPVVLVPLALKDKRGNELESIILRPVKSIDAMTASCFPVKKEILSELSKKILDSVNVSGVFLDITSKPPGTIEWE